MDAMSDELIDWLNEELRDRAWSQRELSRRAKVSQATISQVLANQQKPTWDFCAAIAGPLDKSVDDVFIIVEHAEPAELSRLLQDAGFRVWCEDCEVVGVERGG